jgi:hypothetical protein
MPHDLSVLWSPGGGQDLPGIEILKAAKTGKRSDIVEAPRSLEKLAVTFAPGGHQARAVRARCGRFSRGIGRPGPAWEHEAV